MLPAVSLLHVTPCPGLISYCHVSTEDLLLAKAYSPWYWVEGEVVNAAGLRLPNLLLRLKSDVRVFPGVAYNDYTRRSLYQQGLPRPLPALARMKVRGEKTRYVFVESVYRPLAEQAGPWCRSGGVVTNGQQTLHAFLFNSHYETSFFEEVEVGINYSLEALRLRLGHHLVKRDRNCSSGFPRVYYTADRTWLALSLADGRVLGTFLSKDLAVRAQYF